MDPSTMELWLKLFTAALHGAAYATYDDEAKETFGKRMHPGDAARTAALIADAALLEYQRRER